MLISRVPALQRMLDGAGSRLHATAHAGALTELQRAGLTRLPAELTAAWVALTDDRKYSRDVGAQPPLCFRCDSAHLELENGIAECSCCQPCHGCRC